MNWKENIAKTIDISDFSDRQIYAWTNITPSVLSKISQGKLDNLKIEYFIKLMLLFKKDYEQFIFEIFGENYFSDVEVINTPEKITPLGTILSKYYHFESLITKKELSKATGILSSRINYMLTIEDGTIKVDELTKIELALSLPIGTLAQKRFSKIKLNTPGEYELILKKLKDKS